MTDDDAEVLRDLRLRALADAPDAFGQTLEEARGRLDAEWQQQVRQASRGDSRIWLLAVESGAAGDAPRYVGLVSARRRPPDTVMVFSMWVEPSARRRGVGRALIDALTAWGHAWGGTRMVLWVFAANEPAIRFYQRLGFATETDGEDADSGRAYGAIAMSRAIDAS